MYVSRFITHITNYDLIFLIVEVADVTTLAVWTFPRILLYELYIESRLMTLTVHNTTAMTALYNCWLFKAYDFQASLALRLSFNFRYLKAKMLIIS